MTRQSQEKLIFKGKEVYMDSEPLASYLSNLKEKPKLTATSSACWRGYYGTWEIEGEKLYLIALKGYTADTTERKCWKIGMDFLFPNQTKVFAEWFSGEIRIPIGREIQYVHMGYESMYEKDLIIHIEDGVVISKIKIDNI